MQPEPQSQHREFSQLVRSPVAEGPVLHSTAVASIARAGINLFSPAAKCTNYPAFIARELALKSDFITPSQPVCKLQLSGFPLRQFSSEDLTELVFRICSRYKVLEGDQAPRIISLTPSQCVSSNLALLKGLGFNCIRLGIDATLIFNNRPLASLVKAIDRINDFNSFKLGAEIYFSSDTNAFYLEQTVNLLGQLEAQEIEFYYNNETHSFHQDRASRIQALDHVLSAIKRQGYRLLGDRYFKKQNHSDFELLKRGDLAYGPWGFHHRNIVTWLGLGVGSDGLVAGHLYHNSSSIEGYKQLLRSEHSPIWAWSQRAIGDCEAFRFIQQIYCHHLVDKHLFNDRQKLLDNLLARGWLVEKKDCYRLTKDGVIHLASLCNLYNRQKLTEKPD